jgi:hypothetical protein
VLGRNVPLPLGWILGEGHAEEQVLSETRFAMVMTLTHGWFGELYRYYGVFEMQP